VYFPDLSPYNYVTKLVLPDVLNVGWLDHSMPYTKGSVPTLKVAPIVKTNFRLQ